MEPRETSISLWSRRVMEACWLLALILIPVYFSLLSDRHFEPDKAVTLRALALILGAAWIINILERGQVQRAWPRWRDWRTAPLLVPTLVYAGVFLLTTVTSILMFTSFFGGYNRLQGTYTNLSYIVIFGAIVAQVRRREQLERLITVIIATSLPVLGYGWIQYRAIDPLPWAGNTAARVASTMGNSIFVAAYLIIVLPFVLYRFTMSIIASRRVEASGDAERADFDTAMPLDLAWLLTMGLLVVGQTATLYGVLKLGALLQAPLIGFGHWWIFPAAIIATGSTLTLFSYRTTTRSRNDWRLYLPGVLVVLFMLALTLGGYLTAPACPDEARTCYNLDMATASRAINFRSWLLVGIGAFLLFYLAVVLLPRRTTAAASPLMSSITALVYGVLAIFTVLIIFFTQSRGPQIGMFVSIFTFVTLVLLQGLRTTSAKRLFGAFLGLWMLITVAGAGFLIILNTTDSFAGMRQNRYIARLGNLLETESGTGIVRVLIWRGDDKTQGAVGLVTANPVRTIIGWGPETMFVAYNQFYPPRLANYESRGASPDRSHQAMLDELVTKGALGLFSHLFLYGSFAILMLRLLRVPRGVNLALTALFMLGIAAFFAIFLKSMELGLISLVAGMAAVGLAAWLGYARPLEQHLAFRWQILIITCISAVVANFVENVFGIPIVSSLLYTWAVMAIGVVGGMFAGAYTLGREAQVVAAPVVEEAAPIAGGTRRSRGAASKRPSSGRTVRTGGNAPARAVYPIIGILALVGVWFFNLDNIYADMRFLQAKQWIEQGNSFDTHVLGYAALREAIDSAPNEDLYYLMYGRALMSLATDVSQIQNDQLQKNPSQQLAQLTNRQPDPRASLDQLPAAEYNITSIRDVARKFASNYGPLQILDYARLALEAAKQLNPGNKDHPANLGRLHASWFRNIERVDPGAAQVQLDQAIASYAEAHKIAPQDVELAGQWAMLYMYKQDYARVVSEMERIVALDRSYAPSLARLGEAKRRQRDLKGAAEAFAQAIALDPRVLTNSLLDVAELPSERSQRTQDILADMQSDPALLDTFLAGYGQAITRRPEDLGYRQLYTQILSDTGRYQQGLSQAKEALPLAAKPEYTTIRQTFERFIAYFQARLNS